jgi:hypothetical protein
MSAFEFFRSLFSRDINETAKNWALAPESWSTL